MSDTPLNVLVLNASLKHAPLASNTEELTELVLEKMEKHAPLTVTVLRLSDMDIPAGIGLQESPTDEWPRVVEMMTKADIVIFATPIWWGSRSSIMQRVTERMDAFDEGTVPGGRAVLLNKVAGIVITGSEDGAQAVAASLMAVLSFMNFTIPPQCTTYWVGEVGQDTSADSDRRRKNEAVARMAEATAKNLVYYAKLLKNNP